jgi:hypothetical protein
MSEQICMSGPEVYDEMTDGELEKLMRAAYPESSRITLVERKRHTARWRGTETFWTGEVEFRCDNTTSSNVTRYLVWPARAVLTNGVVLLSGLILPNEGGIEPYRTSSAERIAKKETIEAVFATVKIVPGSGETSYRDVVVKDAYAARDEAGGRGTSFHVESREGLFRVVATRALRAGSDGALIEEVRLHVYELVNQEVVLAIPASARRGEDIIFRIATVRPEWRDLDDDHVAELILKDSENGGFVYKWQQGVYVFSTHGKIKPAPKKYEPEANPFVRIPIVVKDQFGAPVAGCEISGYSNVEHMNILAPYKEPKRTNTSFSLKTDAAGGALFEGKARCIYFNLKKSGYTDQKAQVFPGWEPPPEILSITMRKVP